MDIDLGTEDALLPVPRGFWAPAAAAAVIGVAVGVWHTGRMTNGPPMPAGSADAFFVVFKMYLVAGFLLAIPRRTRRLGLLLYMGFFIAFFGFVGGMYAYWLLPGVRTTG
jgi:hypothetical protein